MWDNQINMASDPELFEVLDRVAVAETSYGSLQSDLCLAIYNRTNLFEVVEDCLRRCAKDPAGEVQEWVFERYGVDIGRYTGRVLFDSVLQPSNVGGL